MVGLPMLKCKIKQVGYGDTAYFNCPKCGCENSKYVIDLGRITARVGWAGNCWNCDANNPNVVRLFLNVEERIFYNKSRLIKC